MWVKHVYLFLFLVVGAKFGESARILAIVPGISSSHQMMMGKLADYLVKDGHDVTFLILEYSRMATSLTNGTKLAKVIQLKNFPKNFDDLMKDFDLFGANTFSGRLEIEDTFAEICDSVLERRSELEALKKQKFDIALTDGVEFCGIGLAKALDIQNQITFIPNPILEHVAWYTGVPIPLSYVPTVLDNNLGPKMNLMDKYQNIVSYLKSSYALSRQTSKVTDVFRKHYGPSFPSIGSLTTDTNLVLVNGNEFLDAARPILHKTIYIGGLGLDEPKPLVEPYESLMSKGKKGVIMFSLGTIAPTTFIKKDLKEAILEAFSDFPDYQFIVKIDKKDEVFRDLAAKYENVDVFDWLPQSDILAHTRLKIFIVHGGYNSILESAIRGVPVIVLPLFADQFRNAKNTKYRGFGYYLDKFTFGKETLKTALGTVLNDSSYRNSALRLSHLIKDKPFAPEETFLKWVKFIAKHGTLSELTPEGARMNFIEYFCLDVIFVVFLVTSIFLWMTYMVVRKIVCVLKNLFVNKKTKKE